jgi:hypothetical protein
MLHGDTSIFGFHHLGMEDQSNTPEKLQNIAPKSQQKNAQHLPPLNLKPLFEASGIEVEQAKSSSALKSLIQRLFSRGEK